MTEHAPTDHQELEALVDRLYAAHDLGVFAVFNAMCAEIEAEQITEVEQ